MGFRTIFVLSKAVESEKTLMKRGLLTLIVLLVTLITLSACRRKKEVCAAYNKVEVSEQK
jgi:hypothetical protein